MIQLMYSKMLSADASLVVGLYAGLYLDGGRWICPHLWAEDLPLLFLAADARWRTRLACKYFSASWFTLFGCG